MRTARWLKVTIKDDERAFLYRDGRFVDLLGPGRHVVFDWGRRLTAESMKVVRSEIPIEKALLLKKLKPEIADDHFEIVQASPTDVALVSFDGEPKHVVLPNTTRAFWKTVTDVDVEVINTAYIRV